MDRASPYRRPFRRRATRASTLVEATVRRVGESRGFAVTRVLTHWEEIAGPELAALCRPVRVSYAKGGMGATLTLYAAGSVAPLVQMQAGRLRDRVNGCYGYNAVARIRITQTTPDAVPAPDAPKAPPPPDPECASRARAAAQDVADPALRAAIEALGRAVLRPRST